MAKAAKKTVKKKAKGHGGSGPAAWETAYRARFQGSKFGNDAIGLFALGLQYGIDDLDSVGAESVTGGNNDKKCDIFYFDKEEGRCVVAQCYVSETSRPAAKANKASDLNTAVSWLLAAPIATLPPEIKASASQLRDAVKSGDLTELSIWYVHNCPESKNVADEMRTVEHTAANAIQKITKSSTISVLAREFGAGQFDKLYRASGSPILVTAELKTVVERGYQIKGGDWSAFQTFVPGTFIYKLFSEHKTDLFSANVRDYLGSRESDANINNGIKETATNSPENFWVYNNGVTALVNGLSPKTRPDGSIHLTIKGISIVNGAQTTGALGSLDKPLCGRQSTLAGRRCWLPHLQNDR